MSPSSPLPSDSDSGGGTPHPSGSPSPLLAADSVGKSYRGKKVLTAASLRVEPGRITALLGRNGAGKSTLLGIAAGTLQPDHGVVTFRGTPHLRARLPRLAREGLFYLPERGLLSTRRPLRWFLGVIADRFDAGGWEEVVDRLGLVDLLARRPEELSSGERRRAELALVLLRNPICLLADEPFLGMAPVDRELVAGTLRRLRRAGRGIAVTGHEVPELLELADEVVWLTGGTTRSLGPPAAAREHPEFVRSYLGRAPEGTRVGEGRASAGPCGDPPGDPPGDRRPGPDGDVHP